MEVVAAVALSHLKVELLRILRSCLYHWRRGARGAVRWCSMACPQSACRYRWRRMAFYVYFDVSGTGLTAWEFCEHVVDEVQVGAHAG